MNLDCIYGWKDKSGSFLYLNSLLKCPIQFLFHFLLQEACSFCLLHSSGGGLEATVVARRVAFVYLGAVLLVYANNNHTCGQGQHSSEPWRFSVSHLYMFWNDETRIISLLTAAQWSHLSVLRVDLWDVSNSLTQHVHWNLITILVLPVGSLIASSLDLGSAVSCNRSERHGSPTDQQPQWEKHNGSSAKSESFLTRHPRHYTANIVCNSEEVGHCGGIEKLVLFQRRKDSREKEWMWCEGQWPQLLMSLLHPRDSLEIVQGFHVTRTC